MNHRCFLIAVIVAVMSLVPLAAVNATDPGAKQIDIFGGERGKVPFPHAQHQERIKDCNVCHSVFPQESDAIQRLKEQGKLKKKKVMNVQCIGCHRQDKKAGKPHGPLTCSTCHIK